MPQHTTALTYPTPLGTLRCFIEHGTALEVRATLTECFPRLPAPMRITECRLFEWHLHALDDCPGFTLVGALEANGPVSDDSASGEWLESHEWKNADYIMHLGADDGEILNSMAKANIIPQRFVNHDPDGSGLADWVRYTEKGLEIRVPALRKSEQLVLRFSAAWKPTENPEADIATWYAVDNALHDE